MCLIGFPDGRLDGPELGPSDAPADGLFWPPAAFGLLLPKKGLTSQTIRASTTTRNAAKPRRKRWRRRRSTDPRLAEGRNSGPEDCTTDQYPTRVWLRHASGRGNPTSSGRLALQSAPPGGVWTSCAGRTLESGEPAHAGRRSRLAWLWSRIGHDLAVDLGTANTLIVVRGRGLVLFQPSCVAVDRERERLVAVGAEAREMLGRAPAPIEVIRPLSSGVISDYDAAQHMLREFILRVHQRRRFAKPRVVVCVPSGVTP